MKGLTVVSSVGAVVAAGALMAFPAGVAAQSGPFPETTITSGPGNPTESRDANFSFTGSGGAPVDPTEPAEFEFECRLDPIDPADPDLWVECLSPQFFSGLNTGSHTFEVRAIDVDGNVDPTPARYDWTVSPARNCAANNGTAAPDADSWIDEKSPIDNKGDDSTLKIQSKAPGENLRALVRFALPAAPAGCSVESATLRLYSDAPTERTLHALRLASAWGENNVTWANQPATSGGAAVAGPGSGYIAWDVTAQTRAMYAGGNHGLLVRDAAENDAAGAETGFFSKEKLEFPPQLDLRFGGVATGSGPGGRSGIGGRGGRPRGVAASLRSSRRSAARTLRRLGIRRLLRRGGATVTVYAPSAGVLRMRAVTRRVTVLRGARRFARAGQARMRLRLTAAGRRALRGKGRVTLTLRTSHTNSARFTTRAPSARVTLTRRGRR